MLMDSSESTVEINETNGQPDLDETEAKFATSPPDSKPAEIESSITKPISNSPTNELAQEEVLDILASARDQDELERDIGQQADLLLTEQADERDNKRLERTETNRARLLSLLRKTERALAAPGGYGTKAKQRAEIANLQAQTKVLDEEVTQIKARIQARHNAEAGDDLDAASSGNLRLPNESRRDFLIRTGKITPFSKVGAVRASSNLADVMLDAEDEEDEDVPTDGVSALETTSGPSSHRNLKRPGFHDDEGYYDDGPQTGSSAAHIGGVRSRKRVKKTVVRNAPDSDLESIGTASLSADDAVVDVLDQQMQTSKDSESADSDEDFRPHTPPRTRRNGQSVRRPHASLDDVEEQDDVRNVDDGNERVYRERLQKWSRQRRVARQRAGRVGSTVDQLENGMEASPMTAGSDSPDTMLDEPFQPHPTRDDTQLDGDFRIPGDIYPSLFDYQKTGVRWLWELYAQNVGGIIGDEMGLGKTIQVISFLAGLYYSRKLTKPVIVVAPATVMKQWVNEFHRWWPPLRVSILHTSGSGMINIRRENQIEEDLEDEAFNDIEEDKKQRSTKHSNAASKILNRVLKDGHVLVTTYSGLQTYADLLLPVEWGYAVLDEGHKIRNPNTAITMYSKMLRTHNRLILSGTPMQNNLTELWSLFDFVFPMRLGTLVSFRNQFEIPIKMGGYANASNLQVETAMRCAESLKETISPYLLQRFKVDVAADLPKKTERVLFCKLTVLQKDAYLNFLNSEDMNSITAGKRQALYGVDILRKICNHPDLLEHKVQSKRSSSDYGNAGRSGKMQVVKALIELWKKDGHKTLLFAQHRIMLDILEKFMQSLPDFKYRRMDGTTSIQERQILVDEFNRDPGLHVFLLTTKVGGLGVNLTGANRVIIYDPDWNPSTDVQARERAWRLGQKREVEIYRLMTAGTIEEKIYHRQIFKQFLSNKILRDPKQRQTFQLRDLHDLFSFGTQDDGATETGSIFKGTEVNFGTDAEKTRQTLPESSTDKSLSLTVDKTSESDLVAMRGVHHQEEFRASDDGTRTANTESDAPEKQPDRLLSTIFARSGVQSALEHDAIMGSNSAKGKVTADPETIAQEARRVASKAATELRKAGEIARSVPAGVPTWTGLHGTTGRPTAQPRISSSSRGNFGSGRRGGTAGPSSSSILTNLASRQRGTMVATSSASASSSRGSTPQQGQVPRGKDFMILIQSYIKAQGGSAYTQMLIDHFNRYCGTPERTAEFKEMLKTIATLDKGPRGRGRGRWVLKEEWRD